VPLLDIDVHDVDGLTVIADHLFERGGSSVVATADAG